MPTIKKTDNKKPTTPAVEETMKAIVRPTPPPTEPQDEDRIDFVNVKDLIKGMEKQKNKEFAKSTDFPKEANGFHKKIDNGHENGLDRKSDDEKTDVSEKPEKIIERKIQTPTEKPEKTFEQAVVEKTEKVDEKFDDVVEKDETIEMPSEKLVKTVEKSESTESTESSLSRSNSYVNGVPVQVPKPLPRSSISEAGSTEEQLTEAPKPKPRTTTAGSGYKVFCGFGLVCYFFVNFCIEMVLWYKI